MSRLGRHSALEGIDLAAFADVREADDANGDALRCARVVHFEKAEENAGTVPKEMCVRWCKPAEWKGSIEVVRRSCFSNARAFSGGTRSIQVIRE